MNAHDEAMRDVTDLDNDGGDWMGEDYNHSESDRLAAYIERNRAIQIDLTKRACPDSNERRVRCIQNPSYSTLEAERDALLAVVRATMRVRQFEGDIGLSTDELEALDALPDNIKKEVEG